MYYYMTVQPDDLQHHGILGMHWGVRRYQNKDGTLTSAGKRRYGKMSGEETYQELKRQINTRPSEKFFYSPQHATKKVIGPNTRKLLTERDVLEREYMNTDEYKKWNKERYSIINKHEDVFKIEDDKEFSDALSEYDRKIAESDSKKPKASFNSLIGQGRDFIEKGGRDLSMAYLKDLGYSEEVAEEFIRKMARSNRTLGDVW